MEKTTATLASPSSLTRGDTASWDKCKSYIRNPKLQILVFILVTVCTVYLLIGANLQAKWSIIDDHEIFMFLGQDQKMKITEIPSHIIHKTEVGDFGNYTRYRPSYYFLRLGETWMWGANPSLWYLARFSILVFAFFVCWYLVSRAYGSILAYFFTLSLMSFSFWADIWARLGPAEIYAVLGTALFALTYYLIWNTPSRKLYWILLTLGGLIAIGSKENFVIMIMPAWFLWLVISVKQRRVHWFGLVSCLLISAYAALILISVYLGIKKHAGLDVYGQQMSPAERVRVTLNLLRFDINIANYRVKVFLVVTMLFTLWCYMRDKFYAVLPAFFYLTCTLLFILFAHVFQIFFYNGNWPTDTRYDYPGVLLSYFVILVLYVFFKHILGILKAPLLLTRLILGLLLAMQIVTIIFLLNPDRFRPLLTKSVHNATDTQAFTKRLDRAVLELKTHPESILIIESYNTIDLEPIVSLERYLRGYGRVRNRIFIRMNDYGSKRIENQDELTTLIQNLSWYGRDKSMSVDVTFSPISELKITKGNCYVWQIKSTGSPMLVNISNCTVL